MSKKNPDYLANAKRGGITKREYFVAMAMGGLLASEVHHAASIQQTAEIAIKQADATLEALGYDTTEGE